MSKPKPDELISAAVALLHAGWLASALPAELMRRFSLSATEARRVAMAAVKRWQEEKQARPG